MHAFGKLVCLVPVLMLCGCGGGGGGPTLAPVSGKVTYQGKGVPNASVTIMPDNGPVAVGKTDADGNFTVKTGDRNGAVLGPAKVVVMAYESTADSAAAKMTPDEYGKAVNSGQMPVPQAKSLIPEKYSNQITSGLSTEIKSGSNNLPLDLTD